MDLPLQNIPQKTALGEKEMAENTLGGQSPLRRLLLLIDGKRSIEELLRFGKIIGDTSSFTLLQELGYIEFAGLAAVSGAGAKTALQADIENALKLVYGEGIIEEVEKIAHKFPPESAPVEFVNQCKQRAMLLLSKGQVEKIFAPICEKL